MIRLLLFIALCVFSLACTIAYAARQALVPGAMQINETLTQEALVPGFVQVNETVAEDAARRMILVQ